MDNLIPLRKKYIHYIMKRGIQLDDANDIVQEAYLSCLKNGTNEEKWFVACINNQIKVMYARNKMERDRIVRGEIENIPSKTNEETKAHNMTFMEELYLLLDPEEKDVVSKKMEGKTSLEIGEEMGIESSQVRYIFSKIRRKCESYV